MADEKKPESKVNPVVARLRHKIEDAEKRFKQTESAIVDARARVRALEDQAQQIAGRHDALVEEIREAEAPAPEPAPAAPVAPVPAPATAPSA